MSKKARGAPATITDEFDALRIMQRQNAVIPLHNEGTQVLMNPASVYLMGADPDAADYDLVIADVEGRCFLTLAAMKEVSVMPLELPDCAPGFYLVADGFASEFERTREYVLKLQDTLITCDDDEDE